MRKLLFIFLTILFWVSTSYAGVAHYADLTDSGSSNLGTYAEPFNSLTTINAHAFATGDDLYFKEDVSHDFTEATLTIDWTGTSGDHVIIGCYDGDGDFDCDASFALETGFLIIDGGYTDWTSGCSGGWSTDCDAAILIGNVDYIDIQDIYFQDVEGIAIGTTGTWGVRDYITVQRVLGDTLGGGLFEDTQASNYVTVQYAKLRYGGKHEQANCAQRSNCTGHGAMIFNKSGTGSRFKYIVVENSWGEGINCHWGTTNCGIENFVVANTRSTGVYMSGAGQNSYVKNGLVVGFAEAGNNWIYISDFGRAWMSAGVSICNERDNPTPSDTNGIAVSDVVVIGTLAGIKMNADCNSQGGAPNYYNITWENLTLIDNGANLRFLANSSDYYQSGYIKDVISYKVAQGASDGYHIQQPSGSIQAGFVISGNMYNSQPTETQFTDAGWDDENSPLDPKLGAPTLCDGNNSPATIGNVCSGAGTADWPGVTALSDFTTKAVFITPGSAAFATGSDTDDLLQADTSLTNFHLLPGTVTLNTRASNNIGAFAIPDVLPTITDPPANETNVVTDGSDPFDLTVISNFTHYATYWKTVLAESDCASGAAQGTEVTCDNDANPESEPYLNLSSGISYKICASIFTDWDSGGDCDSSEAGSWVYQLFSTGAGSPVAYGATMSDTAASCGGVPCGAILDTTPADCGGVACGATMAE